MSLFKLHAVQESPKFAIVQLIRNMKQSLMKQTSNAIKSFQNQPQRSKQALRKQPSQTAEKPLMTETDTDHVCGERDIITPATHFQSSMLQNTICQEASWHLCHRLFVAAGMLFVAVDTLIMTVFYMLILCPVFCTQDCKEDACLDLSWILT